MPSASDLPALADIISEDLAGKRGGAAAGAVFPEEEDADDGDIALGRQYKRRLIAQHLKDTLADVMLIEEVGRLGDASKAARSDVGRLLGGVQLSRRARAEKTLSLVPGRHAVLEDPALSTPGASMYPGPGFMMTDANEGVMDALRMLGDAAAVTEETEIAPGSRGGDAEPGALPRRITQLPLFHASPAPPRAAVPALPSGFCVSVHPSATLRHVALEPLHPLDNLGLLFATCAIRRPVPAVGGGTPLEPVVRPDTAVVVDGFVPIATGSQETQSIPSVRVPGPLLTHPAPPTAPLPPSFPAPRFLAYLPPSAPRDRIAQAVQNIMTSKASPAYDMPIAAAVVIPGAAEESDLVRVGDVLLGVSGVCVIGMTAAQIQRTIAAARSVTPNGSVVLHLSDVSIEGPLVDEATFQMVNATATLLRNKAVIDVIQEAVLEVHQHPETVLPFLPLNWATEEPRVIEKALGQNQPMGTGVLPLGGAPFLSFRTGSGASARNAISLPAVPAHHAPALLNSARPMPANNVNFPVAVLPVDPKDLMTATRKWTDVANRHKQRLNPDGQVAATRGISPGRGARGGVNRPPTTVFSHALSMEPPPPAPFVHAALPAGGRSASMVPIVSAGSRGPPNAKMQQLQGQGQGHAAMADD